MGHGDSGLQRFIMCPANIGAKSNFFIGGCWPKTGYLAHGTATDYMYDRLHVPLAFTWEIYGEPDAHFYDCFRMFNPVTPDAFDQARARSLLRPAPGAHRACPAHLYFAFPPAPGTRCMSAHSGPSGQHVLSGCHAPRVHVDEGQLLRRGHGKAHRGARAPSRGWAGFLHSCAICCVLCLPAAVLAERGAHTDVGKEATFVSHLPFRWVCRWWQTGPAPSSRCWSCCRRTLPCRTWWGTPWAARCAAGPSEYDSDLPQ